MGVTTTGVNQTEQHAATERQRLEGRGRAHAQASAASSSTRRSTRSERAVQRHVLVPGHGDRIGLRRLPARRAEQLHPVGRHAVLHLRNQYGGAFAQDSWRVAVEPDGELRRAVGLHGSRGTRSTTRSRRSFPGSNRSCIPTAPAGFVYPGDAGIPPHAVAGPPQVLAAHRRRVRADVRGRLPEDVIRRRRTEQHPSRASASSTRPFQGLSAGIMYSIPPYGDNYLSPAPPLFDTPFITAADGTNNGQPFPHTPAPLDASPSNPGTSVDWSQAAADQRRPVLLPRQRRAVHAQLHGLGRPAARDRPSC